MWIPGTELRLSGLAASVPMGWDLAHRNLNEVKVYTIDNVWWFEREMSPTSSGSLAHRSVAGDVWGFRRNGLAGGTVTGGGV